MAWGVGCRAEMERGYAVPYLYAESVLGRRRFIRGERLLSFPRCDDEGRCGGDSVSDGDFCFSPNPNSSASSELRLEAEELRDRDRGPRDSERRSRDREWSADSLRREGT